MGRTLRLVGEVIRTAARTAVANHLLQMLLLGVIAAAFLLFFLGADIPLVIGVLGIGCATAFAEAANHRARKR